MSKKAETFAKIVNFYSKKLGLQDDIRVVKVDAFRWTLSYEQSLNHPQFHIGMISLERQIQKYIGRPIDLRLESEADKNKREKRNVLNG